MIRFLTLLVSIPLILLIAAFTFNNAQSISIDLFIYQVDIPLAVVLLIALLFGALLGYFINMMTLINQMQKIRRLKQKKEALQGLSGVLRKPDK